MLTMAQPPLWVPPEEFDDYRVLRPLGGGSMGFVFLAEDAVLARKVAVKFTAAPQPDAAARHRFLVEARAAARVQHPNVVSIYRVGELGDRPYLVTEFVRGRNLSELEKPLPWERALAIGVDLARGLAAAHRRGVIHSDVKPANAILGDDGVAKLLDFGLATLLRTEEVPGRVANAGVGASGSPGYMAPELWAGDGPSRRSDVYGLGAVLFELVAGRTPFADVPMALLPLVVREREAPPLPDEGAQAARFVGIVGRCLRRDPAERFASGDDLCEALEGLLRRGAAGAPLPEGNPYRGLRAFDSDHRALFFGRGGEISILLDRLRTDAFVLVSGDSGVGKSSLCRAGVLPSIAGGGLGVGRTWRSATMVPGRRPVEALCGALSPLLGVGAEELSVQLRAEPEALPRLLHQRLGDQLGLVLFVDQLEELLTLGERDEVQLVDRALGALALGAPGVRLVATLRADFLTRFAALTALSQDLSRVLYFLRPLSPERIREVIDGPAKARGARFESEEMIDELARATAQSDGALPLLQFALAGLWEARDQARNLITRAALEAAGGVEGALARHADAVISGLLPPQRVAARRLLSRLVTLEGTRARRTDLELGAQDPEVRGALDALVRGRLLVAQDAEEGSADSAYEVAHEVLVRSWGTLRGWLEEDAQLRAVREGLARSAAEWERLGRSREGLLGKQQLAELAGFELPDLTAAERALVASSRAVQRRQRWVRAAVAAAVPLVAASVYGGMRLAARSETALRVAQHLGEGQRAVGEGVAAAAAAAGLRTQSFARFDTGDREAGEARWAGSLVSAAAAERAYASASGQLEAGLSQDPGRGDVRALLASALYQRALLAEAAGAREQRDELVARFELYDADGELARAFRAPALVSVHTVPVAAAALVGEGESGRDRALGEAPIDGLALSAGPHLLALSAPGRAPVRLPFLAVRGEPLALEVALPVSEAVPDGFVWIPPGRGLFGSAADEETRRGFFDALPLRPVESGPFLIERTEVTFGAWLGFLRGLAPAERARRTPGVQASASTTSSLQLELRPDGRYQLTLQTAGVPLRALEGQPIRYPHRSDHAEQDWRRFPVTAISADDAEAYAAWLRSTGRLPGARLCTEVEWERAARGADGRSFPHDKPLGPGDANIDLTHGKEGLGPDEVGSHPASRSPFGVDDLAGNAFEWTRSSLGEGEFVIRGGSYFHDRKTAQVANRNAYARTWRDATLGMRLCADPR